MGFAFDTVAEYEEEIEFVQAEIRLSIKGEEWSLNTSQSTQRVKRSSLKDLRDYLDQLTTEKKALEQRQAGSGVTGIVPRRNF